MSTFNNQKGFTSVILLIILPILVVLIGGVVVISQKAKFSGGDILPQVVENKVIPSPDLVTVPTPSPTNIPTKVIAKPVPSKTVSITGNLELLFYGPSGWVSPVVRLFDEQLRYLNKEIQWYQTQETDQSAIVGINGGKKYIFKNLPPGRYIVGAMNGGYYQPKTAEVQVGRTTTVTMEKDSSSTNNISVLTGKTFVDSNGNGQYDGGELDVSGVVSVDIYFLTASGEKRINGFSGFSGGPYKLNVGDFFLGKYRFKTVGVQPGYKPLDLYLDLGLYNTSSTVNLPFLADSNPSTIKGKVYVDSNGNGQYDSGETKPDNYFPSVGLERPGGGYRYNTVTTNNDGEYSFSNLSPGDYVLKLDDVPNYSPKQAEVTINLGSAEEKIVNFGMVQK